MSPWTIILISMAIWATSMTIMIVSNVRSSRSSRRGAKLVVAIVTLTVQIASTSWAFYEGLVSLWYTHSSDAPLIVLTLVFVFSLYTTSWLFYGTIIRDTIIKEMVISRLATMRRAVAHWVYRATNP